MLSSWIFLALLLFWAVGAYNRIVRLRSAAVQAFGGLDAHLMRMMAMLGEYEAAQGPAPTAQADARAALWAATTQFGASLAVARARPLDAGAAAALQTGREVLEAAWLAMVRVSEVPLVPDDGAALPLWAKRWEELVAQNALATRQFNDAALQYNHAIGQFPASVLAWLFGFKAARAL